MVKDGLSTQDWAWVSGNLGLEFGWFTRRMGKVKLKNTIAREWLILTSQRILEGYRWWANEDL